MRKNIRLEIRLERLQMEYLKMRSHKERKPISTIMRYIINEEMKKCKIILPPSAKIYNEWTDKS